MSYNLRKISPLDLKASTGIGVKIPFSTQNVFSIVYSTKEQLKYNLINYLLTNKRERIFSPNFGANIRKRLFEQITENSLDDIKQSIILDIESYFTNVNIVNLDVVGDSDNHLISIFFSYNILNTNENDNVVLSIQNI